MLQRVPISDSTPSFSSELFRPMLQRVSISDSTPSFYLRNFSPNIKVRPVLQRVSISLLLLDHSTSEMFRPMLQHVPISDSTPSFFFRNVSPNVAACAHLWFYCIILLQKCFAQRCCVSPSLILLHHSSSEMFRPMLQRVSISDSTPSFFFRNVSPNVAACAHLWFYSIILLQKCFAQCCCVSPSLILLHHSSSEMFRPMLQRVPISDSTASFYFRNVSPNVAACPHLWFYCIILLQKCFAQCCSVCPSLILLHHSTSEMFRPMLQRVSISDSTASFYFRNVSPNVAACPHLWFYSIILLQKCFAQCCSVCPSLILLHHSTSEMFRPMLQRVSISDSTPSFFFRNVSPNVAACVHLWFYSIILFRTVSPNVAACVHPWFYCIILLQKCFAQCCSVCPSLILLHHSNSELFRPTLQRVSIPDSTPSFFFRNVSPNVAACVHLWFYSIILFRTVSPNVAACVHLWFHSIILPQKFFAQY